MTRPEDAHHHGDSEQQAPVAEVQAATGVPAEPPLEAPPAPQGPVVPRTAEEGAALAAAEPAVPATLADEEPAAPAPAEPSTGPSSLVEEDPAAPGPDASADVPSVGAAADGPAAESPRAGPAGDAYLDTPPDAAPAGAALSDDADADPSVTAEPPVVDGAGAPAASAPVAVADDAVAGTASLVGAAPRPLGADPQAGATDDPQRADAPASEDQEAAAPLAVAATTADLAVPTAVPLAPATGSATGPADDAADGAVEDAAEESSDTGGGRRRVALAALAAALVLLVAGAAVLGWQVRGAALDREAREQALTAARQSALNLTSIDREDFAGDVARVLDGATGEFRTDFAGRVDELEKLLEENEVAAEGRVLEAGLVRADRTTATALVVVDSTVRNRTVPEGRVNSYRMKLEVERVGGEWRTASLEFVG